MFQLLSNNEPLPYFWEIITSLTALFLPFVVTYFVTAWKAATAFNGKRVKSGRPPTLPYIVPWLGHVFDFLSDGGRLVASGVDRFGPHVPFRLILGPSHMYIMSSAELVAGLFKANKETSGNRGVILAMEYAFGTPRRSVEFYEADDSGMLPNPIPDCKTKPEDRIFYITHNVITTFLSGPNLTPITTRFQESLVKKVSEPGLISNEWVEIPDLYGFLQVQILEAAVRAMMGEYILSLNPTFLQDFWEYDRGMRGLFMRTPKWLNPGIYRARDKMLENIKRWHRYALEHCDHSTVPDDVEWEPYWGARFERYRQANFHKWTALDETARAAEDVGILWAMNANSIPASAWMLLEILSSPTLESRIRAELAASLVTRSTPSSNTTARKANIVPSYDVVKLCASPLLQSTYAETLRLRVAIMGTRLVTSPSLSLSAWQFQHGNVLTYVSSLAALDPTVWNTGRGDDPHPLSEFWADRFLVYPHDRDSGPLLRQSKSRKARGAQTPSLDPGAGAGARQDPSLNTPSQAPAPAKELISTEKSTEKSHDNREQQQPQFSLEGLAASWIPYGGGVRLCPGRHFAKQEMLVSAAVWLAAYEVELRPGERYEVNKDYYGFGTMPPKGKIAARIRRRMS